MNTEQNTTHRRHLTETMKAVVQDRYGGAGVLELRDIEIPSTATDEVLVEVYAAGVDRGVWHLMTGLPYAVRLAGYGIIKPKNPVPGMDVAGRVIAVGSSVTRFRPGDDVFGIAAGSFAELAVASEHKLAHKPDNLTFEQAAAVPVSGLTALQALRDIGRAKPGQHVLIIGASGGVGTFAVQIAKALGAEVTGVCSTNKVDLVRSLGADHVIDYTRDDFADGSNHYDLIIDIGGRNKLPKLRRALTPTGALVIVGGEGGGRWTGGSGRQLRAMALSPFVGQRLTTFISKEHFEDLELLSKHIEAGEIAPAVDHTYRLAEVPDAIRDLEAGRILGKSVIHVRSAA